MKREFSQQRYPDLVPSIQVGRTVELGRIVVCNCIVQEVLIKRRCLEAGQRVSEVGGCVLEGTPGTKFAG